MNALDYARYPRLQARKTQTQILRTAVRRVLADPLYERNEALLYYQFFIFYRLRKEVQIQGLSQMLSASLTEEFCL